MSLRLTPSMAEVIDRARGETSRSDWIRARALEVAQLKWETPAGVEDSPIPEKSDAPAAILPAHPAGSDLRKGCPHRLSEPCEECWKDRP